MITRTGFIFFILILLSMRIAYSKEIKIPTINELLAMPAEEVDPFLGALVLSRAGFKNGW